MIDKLITRQPILDDQTSTFAYELLVKGGSEPIFDQRPEEKSDEPNIVEQLNVFCRDKKFFLPLSEQQMLEGHWSVLPKEKVVIEFPGSIKVKEDIIDAFAAAKGSGYGIALSEFRYAAQLEPLVELSDYIKINTSTASERELEAYSIKYASQPVQLIADQVEELNDYYQLRKMGYRYFQGNYYSKPEIIRSDSMPTSRITKLRLIHEVNKQDFDFREAEDILKHDPGLTVKLLKYVNSAAMGLRTDVHSIRQALTMIGQRNLRKWISILAVSSFTDKKPNELMRTITRRGQLCELLAPQFGFDHQQAQSLFLIGLFSLLDAVIDLPMEKVFDYIPLSDDIRETVIGEKTPFYDVLDLAILIESGNWTKVADLIAQYDLDERQLIEAHVKAIEWSDSISE